MTTVINHNSISSYTYTGAQTLYLINYSTINGVPVNQSAVYVKNNATIVNLGTIDGSNYGVTLHGGGAVFNRGTSAIINEYAKSFNNAGIAISGGVGYVYNSGGIGGSLAGVYLKQGGKVVNAASGKILSDGSEVIFAGGAGTLINSGTIQVYQAHSIISGDAVRFVNTGGIVTNNAGGILKGFDGVFAGGAVSVTNSGTIQGSVGTPNSQTGGIDLRGGGTILNAAGGLIYGGIGIRAYYGSVSIVNHGTIAGNYRQYSGHHNYGHNHAIYVHAGVRQAASYINNAQDGKIEGSVSIGTNTTFVNHGIINNYYGVAVIVGVGGDFVNNGQIVGSPTTSDTGAVFVQAGATFENAGRVAAFYNSLYNGGNISGTVIIDQSGSFGGKVVGNNGVLVLGTASAGTLRGGLGSQYTGFGRLEVMAGQTWTTNGTFTGAYGVTLGASAALTNGYTTFRTYSMAKGYYYAAAPGVLNFVTVGTGATLVNEGTIGTVNQSGSSGVYLDAGGVLVNTASHVALGTVTVTALVSSVTAASGSAILNAGSIGGVAGTQASVTLVAGATLTNQAGGQVYGVSLAGGGTIVNAAGGTIDATATLAAAIAGAGRGVTVTNAGMIAGNAYGISLAGGGTITNTAGGAISGTTAGVALAGGGRLVNAAGAAITGTVGVTLGSSGKASIENAGTIIGTGGVAIAGLTREDTLIVDQGAVFAGTVYGSGATLRFATAASGTIIGLGTEFHGFGTIVIGGKGHWSAGAGATFGSGAALVVDGHLTFTAGGTVSAPTVTQVGQVAIASATALTSAAGVVWTLSSASAARLTGPGTFVNQGSLVGAGGNDTVGAPFLNAGLVEANAGSLTFLGAVSNGGTMIVGTGAQLSVTGHKVTGAGLLDIRGGGTLTLLAGAAVGQSVEVETGAGTLDLGAPLMFAGKITGFAVGDRIDLLNTPANSEQFASGMLTVKSGGATVAALRFSGNYTSENFALSSDGHSGTFIDRTS